MFVGEAPGYEEDKSGPAVRRPLRPAARPHDGGDRARRDQRLHRQHRAVAAARQPHADAAGVRDLPAVHPAPDRARRSRRAGVPRRSVGADAAQHPGRHHQDRAAAGIRSRPARARSARSRPSIRRSCCAARCRSGSPGAISWRCARRWRTSRRCRAHHVSIAALSGYGRAPSSIVPISGGVGSLGAVSLPDASVTGAPHDREAQEAHVEAARLRKLGQRLGDVEGKGTLFAVRPVVATGLSELQRADRLRRGRRREHVRSLPAPGTGHRRACDRPPPRHAARSTCVEPAAFRPSRAWAFAAAGAAAAPVPAPRRFPARRDRRRSRARAPAPRPSAARSHAHATGSSAAAATAAPPRLKARRVSFMTLRTSRRTAQPGSPPPASPRRSGRRGSCTAHR